MPAPQEAEMHELHEEEPAMDEEEAPAEHVLDRLEAVGAKVTSFVIERPLTAVAIAVAAGFLFGRMARRSR